MGHVLSFAGPRTIRESLIARLVRQVAADCHGVEDANEVLRVCIGAALSYDLTDAETQWLMSGLECQMGLSLNPMARIA